MIPTHTHIYMCNLYNYFLIVCFKFKIDERINYMGKFDLIF